MKAEIVSVGTELLLGHAVNTDAAFLGRELAQLGIALERTSTVGDNPGRLRETLLEALARADLVITTGGLGPTMDDLTKKTAADALGLELCLDEGSLADLKAYFKGRHMGENQLLQAWLPKGSAPLRNAVGTAPGCLAETAAGKLLAMLPGPPRELEPMFREQLAPLLARRTGCAIVSRMVRTFNQSEGDAALKLGTLCEGANPSVATYIDELNQTYVRITASAASRKEAEALAAPVVGRVKDLLGDVVWGVDEDSLEQAVVRMLAQRREEVATAESCTGGLVAKRLTDCAGSSAVFRTGLVTYANETKTRLLGVPEAMLAEHGAVSRQVARTMAEAARTRAGATYGIGITGIAGPGGGTPQKPVGLVWIALACPEATYVQKLPPFGGRYPGRDALRQRSAGMALDMLRRRLQGRPVCTNGAGEPEAGRQG